MSAGVPTTLWRMIAACQCMLMVLLTALLHGSLELGLEIGSRNITLGSRQAGGRQASAQHQRGARAKARAAPPGSLAGLVDAQEIWAGYLKVLRGKGLAVDDKEFLHFLPEFRRRGRALDEQAVAFLVMTGPRTRSHMEALAQGWLSAVPKQQVWIFSGEASTLLNHQIQAVPQALVDAMGDDSRERGQLRKLATYKVIEAALPQSVEWLVVADDTTFVNAPRMYEYLAQFNPEVPLLLGHVTWNNEQEWIAKHQRGGKVKEDQHVFQFLQGSTGMAITRAALQLIAPRLANKSHTDTCWPLGAEDASVGQCALQVGAVLLNNPLDYPNWQRQKVSPAPDNNMKCQVLSENEVKGVECASGKFIKEVVWASWGSAFTTCKGGRLSSRRETDALQFNLTRCLHRDRCTVPAISSHFGDPVPGKVKHFKLQVRCGVLDAEDAQRAIHNVDPQSQDQLFSLAKQTS